MDNKLKKHRSLYIPYAGPVLLEFPLLNKGSAFSMEERSSFNLLGLLPEVVETIEEQAERARSSIRALKPKSISTSTCVISRTRTKPSSTARCRTISKR